MQCSSCYRGIHNDCLTKEDCDKLDSDGITCSVCITSNKKRALAFPSNSQRLPPHHHLKKTRYSQFITHSLFSPPIAVNRAKWPSPSMSQSALKIPPIEQSNSSAKERLKKFSPKIKKLPKRKRKIVILRLKTRQHQILNLKWVEPSNLPGINIFTAQLFLLPLRNNCACCYISFHFLPVK